MRDPMIEIAKDPVSEARRYVENAKDLLKNHGQLDYETQLYLDRKIRSHVRKHIVERHTAYP